MAKGKVITVGHVERIPVVTVVCKDCGQRPPCMGSDGLCQSCEIAHIEDARLLVEVETIIVGMIIAKGLGLSGDYEWL